MQRHGGCSAGLKWSRDLPIKHTRIDFRADAPCPADKHAGDLNAQINAMHSRRGCWVKSQYVHELSKTIRMNNSAV